MSTLNCYATTPDIPPNVTDQVSYLQRAWRPATVDCSSQWPAATTPPTAAVTTSSTFA